MAAINYKLPTNIETYTITPSKDLKMKITSTDAKKMVAAYNLGRNQAEFDTELSNFLKS